MVTGELILQRLFLCLNVLLKITQDVSYLAAFVLSGHIVQDCSVINEGIQFPRGKGKLENYNKEMRISDLKLKDNTECASNVQNDG